MTEKGRPSLKTFQARAAQTSAGPAARAGAASLLCCSSTWPTRCSSTSLTRGIVLGCPNRRLRGIPQTPQAADVRPGLVRVEALAENHGLALQLGAAHLQRREELGLHLRVLAHPRREHRQVVIVPEPVCELVRLVAHGLHHRWPERAQQRVVVPELLHALAPLVERLNGRLRPRRPEVTASAAVGALEAVAQS